MRLNNRINWIDNAKAIGIFLVFYGHYIEFFGRQEEYNIARHQFRLIYSFHMPLFFIISGFFLKKNQFDIKIIKHLFKQIIIPIISFAILTVPFWYFYNDISLKEILTKALYYIGGSAPLNITTWFLFCLFSAKIFTLIIGLQENLYKNIITSILLLSAGYFITNNINLIQNYTKIGKNFWYIHEGIIASGFLYLGYVIFDYLKKLNNQKNLKIFLLIISCLLFMFSYYFIKNDINSMVNSSHGKFFPFIIHAILGSITIIILGMVIPSNKILSFYGKNTLILLGLNGFFFHFLNKDISNLTINFTHNSWFDLSINSTLYCLISLIICYPFINLFNKYLPQYFGKPTK
ncbi:acyltransferase family protein [Cloacibacterium sp.]|uniref:acyltransferase family protein n=1 Tax=Cloacibacterium sp. TaxID=1913682 RepID=UPI0039E5AF53